MNPTLTLTRFIDADVDAPRHDAIPYELDPVEDRVGMCDLMQWTADYQQEQGRRFWWSTADYAHGHSKDDWLGTHALAISYRREMVGAVADKLRDLNLRFIAIETRAQRKQKTITFVLPLDEYVTDPERYTRLAAEIIHGELGIYGVIEGSWSCTYLFRPDDAALVGGGAGELLSPTCYREKWAPDNRLYAWKFTPAQKPKC